jgi:hypothetical protein
MATAARPGGELFQTVFLPFQSCPRGAGVMQGFSGLVVSTLVPMPGGVPDDVLPDWLLLHFRSTQWSPVTGL